MSYEQTKKIATRFFNKVYIHKKKFGARALARAAHVKPHIAVKIEKSSKFGLGGRIFYRRAHGSARAPKEFFHRILHKILHLPDTLNMFISLELVAVDGFEVGALKCTSEHHRVKKKPSSFKQQKVGLYPMRGNQIMVKAILQKADN